MHFRPPKDIHLQSIGTDTHHLLLHLKAPRFAHTVYLYVPYDSNNQK
jgi:hypothetical protein